MAKEQKAIAKFLDKDGIAVDFWRFPIKNVDKIIGQVLEMVGKSRLGLSKDDLKNFDTFVIQTTEPNGTVIDTIFECNDVEFLDLVKEDYKEYFGYYPSEDKFDSEKWSYILSGHKGYKELKKSVRKSIKEENKIMNKKLTEKFDPPKDWDFDEMVEEYGEEYLNEIAYDWEDYVHNMDDLEYYLEKEDLNWLLNRIYFGGQYYKGDFHTQETFDPNEEYYVVNAYGNFYSLSEYNKNDFIKNKVEELDDGEESFYNWCVEQGYFESDEDDE